MEVILDEDSQKRPRSESQLSVILEEPTHNGKSQNGKLSESRAGVNESFETYESRSLGG